MVQLVLLRSQTGSDVPQTFPEGYLSKGHAQVLIQAGEIFYLVVAAITFHTPLKSIHGEMSCNLGKNELA